VKEIIGIDAGGSKARVLVGERDDLERGIYDSFREGILGPCNYRQVGINGVRELIKKMKTRFEIEDPQTTLVVGGFAGAGTPESHSTIKGVFGEEGFKKNNIFVMSDAGLVLMSIGNNGIVLIAGTGSICVGKYPSPTNKQLIETRAGGYGFRSLSEPGGYQIGMRAIDAALKIEDGRKQEPTVLYQKVKEYFRISNIQQLIPLLYPESDDKVNVQEKVAGLSKIVLQSAHEGDRVTCEFVKETVDELADYIQTVYKKLGFNKSVVGLHGGLFKDQNSCELIIKPLQKHPYLNGFDLEFETLGVRDSDKDLLIEALKFTILKTSF